MIPLILVLVALTFLWLRYRQVKRGGGIPARPPTFDESVTDGFRDYRS